MNQVGINIPLNKYRTVFLVDFYIVLLRFEFKLEKFLANKLFLSYQMS
jgi:hypothetical protein